VTVILQPPIERGYYALLAQVRPHVRRRRTRATEDDVAAAVELNRWSPRRPLDPALHRVEVDLEAALPQQWFNEDTWRTESLKDRGSVHGTVCQVMSYTLDHGEAGDASKGFQLTVSPSTYAGGVTVQRLCLEDEQWERVRRLLLEAPSRALRVAPDQHFFVALTISTPEGYTLAVRRSSSLSTARNAWSLALCETMNAVPSAPGHSPETLFDAARRAAWEEAGLSSDQIGHIWFSWFGFSRTDGLMAVAHCLTNVPQDHVTDSVRNAEGGYEASDLRWLSLKSEEFRSLAQPGSQPDWVPFTNIVAEGLRRMWPTLRLPPHRR
jgi:hypothetical protein